MNRVITYQGIRDCFENANSLYTSAQKIADADKRYGTANSLLVLSGEECVKGYVLLAVYFDIQLEFEIEPYFRKHSTKHITGKEVIGMTKVTSLLITAFAKDRKSKLPNSIMDIADLFFGNDQEEKWWDSADDQKKKGFYVDLINGKFSNPSCISLEMYQTSLRIISRYIRSLSVVESLKPDDYRLIPR
ncbi:MAG: AbiV family abortive infection protein [Cyclobacteriaceae bacterium]|nr:AbiV family abortive infection protein [Cyclobacteriaceae bacterium]